MQESCFKSQVPNSKHYFQKEGNEVQQQRLPQFKAVSLHELNKALPNRTNA